MRGAFAFALFGLLTQGASSAAIVPTAALAPSIPGHKYLGSGLLPNASAEVDEVVPMLSNVHTSILNGARSIDPAPAAHFHAAARPPRPTSRRPPQSPPTSRRSRRRR